MDSPTPQREGTEGTEGIEAELATVPTASTTQTESQKTKEGEPPYSSPYKEDDLYADNGETTDEEELLQNLQKNAGPSKEMYDLEQKRHHRQDDSLPGQDPSRDENPMESYSPQSQTDTQYKQDKKRRNNP